MKLKYRREVKVSAGLMLTPMLDVLTVVLIFLILNFSPDKAQLNINDGIRLPGSEIQLKKVPELKIEVTAEHLRINGEEIPGLHPQSTDSELWAAFKAKLESLKKPDEPVMLVADREISYDHVDRTVARLASIGISDIYLLTSWEERQ